MNKNSLKKIGYTLLATAVVSTSLLPSISDAANRKYKLNKSVKTFISTDDASRGVNVRGTYGAGEYYIYKELNDYVNISRSEGVPGAWVKKSDNGKTLVAQSSSRVEKQEIVTVSGKKVKLSSPTKIYFSADDAKAQRNSRGTYAAGEYYVYKNFNGAYNISRVANQPGGWVNSVEKIVTKVEIPVVKENTSTTKVESGKYKLDGSKAGYITAEYAKGGRNASTTLAAGEYYIYKSFEGMLNLSKQKNVPGAWINPNSGDSSSKLRSETDIVTPIYSSNIGQEIVREARKYIGLRYVFGGSNPGMGFDCSGLTSYVLTQVKGATLARTSRGQSQGGQYVSPSNLQAGDLLFYGDSATNIYHVGIYNGNGGIIHASDYGIGVVEVSLNSNFFRTRFQFAKRY